MSHRKNDPPQDYMKYWRVVRYFILAKYKITTADLDMLMFLYSEPYFNKSKFNEFDELMAWDASRFDRLLRDGWIVVFRKRNRSEATLYEISYRGRRMIGTLYKKLNGEEIPESKSVNPMFLVNASYSDKIYRNYIKEMNKFIRQQRHLSRQ